MLNELYRVINKYLAIEYVPFANKNTNKRLDLLKYAKDGDLKEYHKYVINNHEVRQALERKYTLAACSHLKL